MIPVKKFFFGTYTRKFVIGIGTKTKTDIENKVLMKTLNKHGLL